MISNKILKAMTVGKSYTMSGIGYAVHGGYTATGQPMSAQGAAFAVGAHVNKLVRSGEIISFLENGFPRYRLPDDAGLFAEQTN